MVVSVRGSYLCLPHKSSSDDTDGLLFLVASCLYVYESYTFVGFKPAVGRYRYGVESTGGEEAAQKRYDSCMNADSRC